MRWFVPLIIVFAAAAVAADEDLSVRIQAAQKEGRYAEAADLYRQLIASGADGAEIQSNYGVMLYLSGKSRESLDQLRIALRANPKLASANLFAGLAEVGVGQPKAALDYLNRAKQLDPASPAPLVALGQAYTALRQYRLANESYVKATVIDSNLPEAWYGAGITYRSLADQELNRIARGEPASRDKAKAFLADAQKSLARAVQLDPASPRAHLILAESLRDEGNLTEAVREYQTVIKLDRSMEAAYLGLATTYWKNRQFDEALPLLQHVLAQSPADPEANGIMADILEHEGQYDRAKRCAEIALRGNPNLIETRVVLARIYLAQSEPKLAIDQLQKVLNADRDGSSHFLLYRALKQTGDDQQATAALAKYQELHAATSKP
jgi:tetratricopeptide (TPR) repeat protein